MRHRAPPRAEGFPPRPTMPRHDPPSRAPEHLLELGARLRERRMELDPFNSADGRAALAGFPAWHQLEDGNASEVEIRAAMDQLEDFAATRAALLAELAADLEAA